MSDLLEEVSRDHFPRAPATPEELEEFERRVGWKLDPDLRAFYLHCNGAELLKRRPNTPYRILLLSKIVRARVAIYGEDDEQWGPASVYALCDVHEAWPDPKYCGPVASSSSEFLEQVLRTRRNLYWLGE
jgi:hypothetical protein